MSHIRELRQNTNYPVLRSVIRTLMTLAYLGTMLLVVAALGMMIRGGAQMWILGLALFATTPVLLVAAHLTKELATMTADIADAAVAISENLREQNDPPQANLDWQLPDRCLPDLDSTHRGTQ